MINLKEKVLYCLEKDKESRNSDIRLTQTIWWIYHKHKIFKGEDGDYSVKLKELFDLPREDNIKRVRAIIQNEENKFLPTRIEVVKKRKLNEERWRNYINENNLNNSNPSKG